MHAPHTKLFAGKQGCIRAELSGCAMASALGVFVRSSTPVLALCRALVAAGHDPDRPLEAWRGGVLCLRVRSICEVAGLRVASHGVGFERLPECTAAPPMRLSAAVDVPGPRLQIRA